MKISKEAKAVILYFKWIFNTVLIIGLIFSPLIICKYLFNMSLDATIPVFLIYLFFGLFPALIYWAERLEK